MSTTAHIEGRNTPRRERREPLTPEMARFALDAISEPVAVTAAVRDDNGVIIDFRLLYANDAAVDLDGRRMRDLIGQTALATYPDMDHPYMFRQWVRVVETGVPHAVSVLRYERSTGRSHVDGWFQTTTVKVGDGCLHMWRDISDSARKDAAIRRQATALEHEQRAVTDLQRAILPNALPTVDGVLMGAGIRAANGQYSHEIGGDWYDVFTMNGKVVFVLGDVNGHGTAAARMMSQLRDAVRAYSKLDVSPSEVLRLCNQYVLQFSSGHTATVVYMTLDPGTGLVRWAQAGHLPPLLCADGSADFLHRPDGLLLGASGDPHFGESLFVLDPAMSVVCFSDGIVETRGDDIDEGLEELRRIVLGAGISAPATLCRVLIEKVSMSREVDDDMTALAFRLVQS